MEPEQEVSYTAFFKDREVNPVNKLNINCRNYLKNLKKVLTFPETNAILTKSVRERRQNIWDHSSAGRASALQAEGHRFEPYWSHTFSKLIVAG